MRRLLVASANAGKIAEIARLLAGLELEVVGLEAYPDFTPGEEPYATFAQNAAHKALAAAQHAGGLALADDSGLEVDALDGRPGIYSARYGRDDTERISKLLAELADVPAARRTARFVCAVALAEPAGVIRVWEGRAEGMITAAPRGGHGFGYDPVFAQGEKTFAELTREEKNLVSHRGQALRAFLADLPSVLHGRSEA